MLHLVLVWPFAALSRPGGSSAQRQFGALALLGRWRTEDLPGFCEKMGCFTSKTPTFRWYFKAFSCIFNPFHGISWPKSTRSSLGGGNTGVSGQLTKPNELPQEATKIFQFRHRELSVEAPTAWARRSRGYIKPIISHIIYNMPNICLIYVILLLV